MEHGHGVTRRCYTSFNDHSDVLDRVSQQPQRVLSAYFRRVARNHLHSHQRCASLQRAHGDELLHVWQIRWSMAMASPGPYQPRSMTIQTCLIAPRITLPSPSHPSLGLSTGPSNHPSLRDAHDSQRRSPHAPQTFGTVPQRVIDEHMKAILTDARKVSSLDLI